jgi:uncharacterized protein YbjQ (UPF0145 family)
VETDRPGCGLFFVRQVLFSSDDGAGVLVYTESQRSRIWRWVASSGSERYGRCPDLSNPYPHRIKETMIMIVTTTPTVEGHPVEEYLGVVTGEAILGAHIGRDILAAFTDIVGGRSAEYEEEVRNAREVALEEMAAEAERRGGNAVVGVDIDYEVIREGMIMVSVSGTAVRIA